MKIAAQRGFWPLRPTPTARGVELGCWLAASVLAVALVISPAQPVRTIGVPQSPNLLAYRQRCIDRVLASDLGMTERYVVRKINRQCPTRRNIATRPVAFACGFVDQLTPIARRVTGCVGG